MRAPARSPWTLVGAVLVTTVVALVVVWRAGHPIDIEVYRLGGRAVLDGVSPYDVVSPEGLLFTYPPFAALLLAPLALLPAGAAYAVWTALSAVALVALVRVHLAPALARVRVPRPDLVVAGAAVAALGLEPVWRTLLLGQVNVVLVLMVSVDLLVLRPGDRRRGWLTGIAAGTKLTPLVFLPLLLLAGQRRDAGRAALGALFTAALGALLLPGPSVTFWTEAVRDPARVGDRTYATDQSVLAALLRLGSGHLVDLVWVGTSVVVVVAALLAGRAWWRLGEPQVAVSAVALAGLLVSPVSWSHHWIWCLPLAVALPTAALRAGLRRRTAVVVAVVWTALFVAAPHMRLPRHEQRELAWTWWQHLVGDLYVLVGLAALAGLVAAAVVAARRAGGPGAT